MEDNYSIPWQVKQYEDLVQHRRSIYFDVDDFEEIVDHYVFKGLYKEAFEASNHACTMHPASIPLMLKRAQLLATFNQEDDALELLSRVESMDPNNNDVYLTKGGIYSQLQDHNKAIEEYNKAVTDTDQLDHIYCNIAIEYENLGNFDKTLEYLDKALKINPDNDLAIYEAAYCFDLLSLTEEGISFFHRLIDRNPYSTEAWFNLGVSYINAGQYARALDALEYSLAIDDKHEHSWFHKGYALGLLNRHREAIEAYEESMANGVKDAVKLYYIGECHEKLEDYDNAISFYIKSSQLDPEMADAWVGIGVCQIEQGNVQEAIHYLKQGLLLDHDNISYLCLLANAYFLLNDHEKATSTYEQALEADPEDEETWLEYAEALANMNAFKDAIDLLARGVERVSKQAGLLYAMAAVLFLDNKPEEGRFCMEEAYELDKQGAEHLLTRFPKLANNTDFQEMLQSLGQ
ncbi:MAG: tetratricopeptide repeat protein [Bacteroidales bacterium]|nr:tetratricopeptide repeat protein [Bacteroidales bacterium]